MIGSAYGDTMANNHARSTGMTLSNSGGTYTPIAGAALKDGEDVSAGTSAGQYNNQSFWSGLGWDFSTVWQMDTVGGQTLPVLQ